MRQPILLGAVCLCTTLGMALPVTAHPPEEPDHGVNGTSFWDLWSGDEDPQRVDTDNTTAARTLRATSDVPLDAPPKAAETWNQRDIEEMPATTQSTAVHPTGATLANGTYLKDVGVAIAGITPSTRVLVSDRQQPLYIAPNGTVLGTVDYRVAIPPATTASPARQVVWNVTSHEVERVTLLVDQTPVANTTTTNVVRLDYRNQSQASTGNQSLTLRATVSVQLTKTVYSAKAACKPGSKPQACKRQQSQRVSKYNETVTVEQTREVSVYNPVLSGYQTTYPDGDMGVVVFRSQPWYGLELPAGEVRGIWRFYVARDQQWDRIVATDGRTKTTSHSPVHPVQVYAYPIRTGTTQDAHRNVTVLDSYGTELQAPELNSAIVLDTIDGTYIGSFGLAARAPSNDSDQSVEATGLVRGTDTQLSPDTTANVTVNRSKIALVVTDTTANTVTVELTLEDASTGTPIATASRDGYIQLEGRRVNTTANGTVRATLPRQGDAVTATYKPDDWWRTIPAYVGDSTTVQVEGTVLRYVRLLFVLLVRIGTLLLAMFLIDRLTGWGAWPPWRHLR